MGTWNSAPQVPNVPSIPGGQEPDLAFVKTLHEYIKKMANVISILKNDLEYMINGNLDVKNIRAKSITADRLKVSELSAISADLGHITAGLIESIEIYGSYIATSQSSYPKCEMSSAGKLFAAYYNVNNKIAIEADYGGTPSLNFYTGSGLQTRIDNFAGFEITNTSTVNPMNIDGGTPGTNMNKTFRFDNWNSIINNATSTNLQTALNTKATAGVSTSLSGSANGGIPIGTVLMVSGGGTVTWTGIPSHSHAQT